MGAGEEGVIAVWITIFENMTVTCCDGLWYGTRFAHVSSHDDVMEL